MEVKIDFANSSDLEQVVCLSRQFESENCCNGIRADNLEYFTNRGVVVAKVNDRVIGYCYGNVEIKTKKTIYFNIGEKSFYLEEIFILPDFRSGSIGSKLFGFIENYAKDLGCKTFETTAVSKDYKKLLRFYIDKQGMNFWSANLIKNIE